MAAQETQFGSQSHFASVLQRVADGIVADPKAKNARPEHQLRHSERPMAKEKTAQ